MDPAIIAAIIGAIATIVAVFIAWILQGKSSKPKEQTSSGALPQVEPVAVDGSLKFARRYLDYPSHYRFVKSLPKLKTVVIRNAKGGWDTGVTADMREASYDVIDFLEYSWLRLAQFYPANHWGKKDAEIYIRDYIRDRFAFHWSKYEPEGPGTGGTIVGVLAGGDVIQDLERLIADTVSALFMRKNDFDFQGWKSEWESESE